VVVALENLSKRPFADALLDLKSVGYMVVDVTDVLSFVVVETAIFRTIRCRDSFAIFLTLQNIQVEDLIVLENLSLFIVKEELGQVIDDIAWLHRELDLEGSLLIIVQKSLPCNGRV
jgi:hypothetical protein